VPNAIVHFEIPADNPKKLIDFYTHLFEWKIEPMPGAEDYWTIRTGEGSIGGGLLRRSVPSQAALNYVRVESVEAHCRRAEARGGRVVHQKQPIPGVGWFAIVADPEGNLVGLFEEDASAAMPS